MFSQKLCVFDNKVKLTITGKVVDINYARKDPHQPIPPNPGTKLAQKKGVTILTL